MWNKDVQSYPRWLSRTNQKRNEQFTLVEQIILEPSLLVLGLTISTLLDLVLKGEIFIFVSQALHPRLVKTPDWCKPE